MTSPKPLLAALALALAACSGVPILGNPAGAAADAGAVLPAESGVIKHVVVIVQENRSFVNIFAGYPGADAPMSGPTSKGKVVALHPIDFGTPDLDHSYGASIQDYNGGRMNGFDKNYSSIGSRGLLPYSYLQRKLVAPYWSMAQQYTLADRMFATEHGASWTAHLDLIGTTNLSPATAVVDFPSNAPWDCAAPKGTRTPYVTSAGAYRNYGPFPCFTQFSTMADTLDAAGVSWRFYAPRICCGDIGGIWSPFGAIRAVRYGPDWKKIVSRPARVLTDVAAGKLAQVTWITPEWAWSDHAGGGARMGPSWVAAVVNAIGSSRFWKDTAIIVLWDDWGGFYDDARPPQLDFKGLGLRVPCLIISPYARHGYVSHTQYEFGSINAFVEQIFDLPPLGTAGAGYSDARATSILDSFDFAQSPPVFTPISAPDPPSSFVSMPESGKVPDDE